MTASGAPTFGLPPCLRIPIAASSAATLAQFVGAILREVRGADGRVNAVKLKAHGFPVKKTPKVPLWNGPKAAFYEARLHPEYQIWVHVDYTAYRTAWLSFGMPDPGVNVLDHIQNRKAMRLRGRSHPYLRLCPVSKRVNTSGGHGAGGEGMEKQRLGDNATQAALKSGAVTFSGPPLVFADPMDLTKMLDIPPGTDVLAGVAATQKLFYPV